MNDKYTGTATWDCNILVNNKMYWDSNAPVKRKYWHCNTLANNKYPGTLTHTLVNNSHTRTVTLLSTVNILGLGV